MKVGEEPNQEDAGDAACDSYEGGAITALLPAYSTTTPGEIGHINDSAAIIAPVPGLFQRWPGGPPGGGSRGAIGVSPGASAASSNRLAQQPISLGAGLQVHLRLSYPGSYTQARIRRCVINPHDRALRNWHLWITLWKLWIADPLLRALQGHSGTLCRIATVAPCAEFHRVDRRAGRARVPAALARLVR